MSDVVRVLHALGGMNRGGQETFIMNVYRSINREKLQFDFLLNNPRKCDYEDEIISLGGTIHRVPRRYPNYLLHLKCLNTFFKNNTQYNIVHQHTNSCSAISTLICAKKHGFKRIIIHSHNSRPDAGFGTKIFDYLYKPRIKKYATHYFACSELAASNLFSKYVKKNEVIIIKNAIDTDVYRKNDVKRKKKRIAMKVDEKFVIGHIGRFSSVKNHSFIIEVFRVIHAKNPDVFLLIVGEGELRTAIEEKVDLLGLKDSVIFTGVRSDVPDLLRTMDVFLLPSLYEGLPVTLVEAQASGLPCVVSDVVTKEVAITDLIEFIPLSESAAYWADRLMVYTEGYERRDTQKAIKQAGFDIKDVASWLEEFYLNS